MAKSGSKKKKKKILIKYNQVGEFGQTFKQGFSLTGNDLRGLSLVECHLKTGVGMLRCQLKSRSYVKHGKYGPFVLDVMKSQFSVKMKTIIIGPSSLIYVIDRHHNEQSFVYAFMMLLTIFMLKS